MTNDYFRNRLDHVIVDSTVREKANCWATRRSQPQGDPPESGNTGSLGPGRGEQAVEKDCPNIEIKHRVKDKRLADEERRRLKRRQAIKPIIGHLKADYRMNRCHLKRSEGDALEPNGSLRQKNSP